MQVVRWRLLSLLFGRSSGDRRWYLIRRRPHKRRGKRAFDAEAEGQDSKEQTGVGT